MAVLDQESSAGRPSFARMRAAAARAGAPGCSGSGAGTLRWRARCRPSRALRRRLRRAFPEEVWPGRTAQLTALCWLYEDTLSAAADAGRSRRNPDRDAGPSSPRLMRLGYPGRLAGHWPADRHGFRRGFVLSSRWRGSARRRRARRARLSRGRKLILTGVGPGIQLYRVLARAAGSEDRRPDARDLSGNMRGETPPRALIVAGDARSAARPSCRAPARRSRCTTASQGGARRAQRRRGAGERGRLRRRARPLAAPRVRGPARDARSVNPLRPPR